MTYEQGLWDAIAGLSPAYLDNCEYMQGYNAARSNDP